MEEPLTDVRLKEGGACLDTDTVLWREPEDACGMSMSRVFMTKDGGLGIEVAGRCVVMPVRMWFAKGDKGTDPRKDWRDVPVTTEFLAELFDAYCGAGGHNLVVSVAAGRIGQHLGYSQAEASGKLPSDFYPGL